MSFQELDRFHAAHADPHSGFEVALRELEAGRKRSHWIWYIFPQLAGLGMSPMAAEYGIRGIDEARAYLEDPVLRRRLLAVTRAVAAHVSPEAGRSLTGIMGSGIDAQKLVSSMTLFREMARRAGGDECAELVSAADVILRRAAEQGLPVCAFTSRALGI